MAGTCQQARSHWSGLVGVLALIAATLVPAGNANASDLSAVKIGTAALIIPSDAQTYYGSSTTHTFGLNGAGVGNAPCTSPTSTGCPPEIRELARALKTNVDLIYDYVHNNIDTVWMFGTQKGALGALIDRSGTPFDQASLMIELLRAANFQDVGYQFGTVTLDDSGELQLFKDATNINPAAANSAQAACQLFANGGIPAAINGQSASAVCAFGTSTVSSIAFRHVWVRVKIGGVDYLFDPSFKPYGWKSALNWQAAMGFASGYALNRALINSGVGIDHSAQGDAAFIRNLNTMELNAAIDGYADSLLAYLTDVAHPERAGWQLEDVVGGGTIIPTYTAQDPQRLTSLLYHASSLDWVNVPDQYRTKLQASGTMLNINSLSFESMFDRTLYVDEIYGRRLTVETDLSTDGIQTQNDWYSTKVYLKLDGVTLNTYTNPALSQNPNNATSRGVPATITLKPFHPYAAAADGSSSRTGDYMDTTVTKQVTLITSLVIAHGWGDTSQALLTKWSNEHVVDPRLPPGWPPLCEDGATPCPEYYPLHPRGDTLREREAASWLAQNTRASRVNAALADALLQMHHAVGVVFGDAHLTRTLQCDPSACNIPKWIVDDSFDRIDVDAAFSLTSRTADALKRRGAIHAIGAASAALEGSLMTQLADLPDTASTAARFEWGNAATHSDIEDPSHAGPRHFQLYENANKAAAIELALAEGVTTTTNSGIVGWGEQPQLSSAEVQDFRRSLWSTLDTYAQAGFSIVASQESFLGPGQRGGTINVEIPGPITYSQLDTKQRGAAFVGTRYDVNSEPVEIAHIVLGLNAAVGPTHTIFTKGGGGGQQPNTDLTYDPAQAADVLKARFVDRSMALGVSLSNGSVAYTSPVALSVGNGGFPYALSAGLVWHPGPRNAGYQPASPTLPQPGWTPTWNNSGVLSSSGMEAMGESDIRAAGGTIAAFVVAQDMYKETPSLGRDVAGVLTMAWWTHQIEGNVLTVSVGAATRQFLRIDNEATVAQDKWILPGAGYATAKQTGERVPEDIPCGGQPPPPYAMGRGWDASAVSFEVTNTNGDKQNFANWTNSYATTIDDRCGRLKGFRLTTWTFPYGVTVTVNYGAPYDPKSTTADIDRITGIENNVGFSIDFAYNGPYWYFPSAIQDGTTPTRQATIQAELSSDGILITGHTDPEGNATHYSYTALVDRSDTQRPVPYANLWRVFTADNLAQPNLEYTYDALGRVKEARDAIALQVGDAAHGGRGPYQFLIGDGTRGERIDPLSQSYVVDYDVRGRPARYFDEVGHMTLASFDGRGRAVSYVYPDGDCERFEYDARNNMTELMRISNNANCDPGTTVNNRITITAAWDETWNKPLWIETALGWRTNFQYRDTGNGTSLIQWVKRPSPDGTAARPQYTFTYTSTGRVKTVTDPDSIVTTNTYNNHSELTQTQVGPDGLGIITQFAYNDDGDVIRTTDPRGNAVDVTYDLNRQRRKTLAHDGGMSATLIAATRTTYDAVGRPIEEEAGLTFSGSDTVLTWQVMRTVEYSPTGKPWKVLDADAQPGGAFPGAATRTYYDGLDRPLTVVDPALRQVHFVYCVAADSNCAANLVRFEQRAFASSIQENYATYTYGLNGQKLSVADANGKVTNYHYDKFIRLDKTTFPDMSHEDLAYDKDGFITTRTTRSGVTITYTPDRLDRIVSKAVPIAGGTRTTTYLYTPAGRTDYLSDDDGTAPTDNTIDYHYDGAGRIDYVERGTIGLAGVQRVNYGLDATGNRVSITWPNDPDNYYVGYGYDALGRMVKACEKGVANGSTCTSGIVLATYEYNTLSQRTTLTYGNSATVSYTTTPGGNLTNLNHDIGGTTDDPHFSYGYTPAHQAASMGVDDADYLWQATGTASDTYSHNNLNQYTAVNGATPSYDANGNMTGDGVAWTYTYDAENRLVAANKTGMAATYTYDPLNHRASKLVNGTYTFFLGDTLDDEIAEYSRDGSNNPVLVQRFVPGPGIDQPIATITANGQRRYFHTDRLGSTVAVSTAQLLAEGPYTYDPYGLVCQGAGSSMCTLASGNVPYKFTGRRLDAETGLYYYRARYYSYGLGRFLQTDPIGYQADLNLYTYVGNDPVNGTDPMGNCPPRICGAEGTHFGIETTDVTFGDVAGLRTRADNAARAGEVQVAQARPPRGTRQGAELEPLSQAAGARFERATTAIRQLDTSSAATVSSSDPNTIVPWEAVFGQEARLATVRDQVSARIAAHSWARRHGGGFGASTTAELAGMIRSVISSPSSRVESLPRGRTAFYDRGNNWLVIVNPSARDSGTAFAPTRGEAFVDELLLR